MRTLYRTPDSNQPPHDYDDEWLAIFHVGGVVSRALTELDPDYRWRTGRRIVETAGEAHERAAVHALVQLLNQLDHIATRHHVIKNLARAVA